MAEMEVPVLCYWNGRIEYGSNGVYYDRSTPRMIKVKRKTELSILLDQLYLLTGLDVDDRRSKVRIFGRFPSVFQQQSMLQFLLLPVVNDSSLETMLEVPSKHPSIKNVELYLEVKSDGVVESAACSPLMANPGNSSKRQRMDVPLKLEKGNSNGWIEDEDEEDVDIGNGGDGDMTDKNPGSDAVAQVVNVTEGNNISHKDLNKDSNSGVSKPCLSSLWLDDHDLRVGLCFRDGDELKRAVDWCSIRGETKCVVTEVGKDECMFKCVRWKCKWSLGAARMEKHGLFEIIKYTGPHTCCLTDPEDFKSEFETDEIERVVRDNPTLSIAELKKWWKEKFSYELKTEDMKAAKIEVIKRVFGDWDQFDLFPNPKFASFCGVFWAFSQSIEGFKHCRPLIIVDTQDLKGKYPMKLLIASGVDAANKYFPLAFAVTKDVSTDIWRWFLTGIREKVTQRKTFASSPVPTRTSSLLLMNRGLNGKNPGLITDYTLKDLVSQAGSTSQKEKFDSYMKDIEKKNIKARKWLDQFPQSKWTLAHDSGRRYGIMKIDATLCYTKSLFAVFRVYQLADHVLTGYVLLMFDELRHSFEELFDESRASLNCGDVYTKPVMDTLEEFETSYVTYVVMPIDNNAFKVTTPSTNNEWIVQLSDCTCTCGEFQRCKFPCLHALAVYKKLKINPLQYVDDCYTLERHCKTYAATFSPVPELSAWPEASGVPTLFPPIIPPPPPTVAGKSQRKTTPKTTKKKS
ncbi:putative transposase, MuDR, plant, Zinc finger, SWIM-type, MULE transposase [Arabidopsis thaliana]